MNSQRTVALPAVPTSAARTSAFLLALIPPAILVSGWFLRPLWAWLAIMALLAAFTILLGHHIVGLWRGAFIDDRNKISLSRLQTILWTVLIVAGFLAAALYNVRTRQPEPLGIALPPQLWALLGISVTALVGSNLIKGQQSTKEVADPQEASARLKRPVARLDDSKLLVAPADPATPTTADPVVVRGVLVVNADPNDSSWLDMFQTEEVGSADHLSLSKIQMFYFTVILVFAYAVTIATLLAYANGRISDFPALDNSIVALLGISHAAYLTNKSVTHTNTDQDT
jgi:hypothetical protein